MNRTKLKTYAPQARRDFIQAVTDRAAFYGLTEKKIEPITENGDVAIIGGRAFPRTIASKRRALEERIDQYGFAQTMEAIAYTWFNRLVAIRYMEVHGYLDHGYRVLSHPDGKDRPEILDHAADVDFPALDHEKATELKLDGTKDEELYQLLLLAQCNVLHQAMPFLFEMIGDETELLLPANLLHTDSLIRQLVEQVDEALWQEIEIVGWLYQFYISEKKDQVIGKVVKSEDIPAATQLFTPNWIVKYMVQNSLGAQWMATYPQSPLKEQMDYYIEPAEQPAEVKAQLAAITPSQLNPEELTLIDPASGSGHILVEAYELFKAIYLERGYRQRDVPQLILEKNLFGLDIDERASQLTGFALMMKGRADDPRFFERGVKLNVVALVDSARFDAEGLAKGVELGDYGLKPGDLAELKRLFEHATTFGSLIQVPEGLAKKLSRLKQLSEATSQDLFVLEALNHLGPLVQQAEMLASNYDAVVANPPYMGAKFFPAALKTWIRSHYRGYHTNLFAAFIVRLIDLARSEGHAGVMTEFAWMFLPSYEELRLRILDRHTISTLVQLHFDAFADAKAHPCSFTVKKTHYPHYTSSFISLTDFPGVRNQEPKTLEAINDHSCDWFFEVAPSEFKKVPGRPIAYWVPECISSSFSGQRLRQYADIKSGIGTSDNDRFLRRWHEVDISAIGFSIDSIEASVASKRSWFPYTKGGKFRRWFGNNEFIVLWRNDGEDIKHAVVNNPSDPNTTHWSRRIFNTEYFFRPSITWGDIGSTTFSARRNSHGFIHDAVGVGAYGIVPEALELTTLAFLNSSVVEVYTRILCPTQHFKAGQISEVPAPTLDKRIADSAASCVQSSRADWDAYERSWDFQSLPILMASSDPTPTLESSYSAWIAQNRDTISKMKRLEEEHNRFFIDAYGLTDELTPGVPIEQITLTVNPAYRYGGKLTEEELWTRFRQDTMAELVSYAIGCMMGRYSLDAPGLIYAHSGNEGFDPSRYTTFPADPDGILPITDTYWFRDDAAHRLVEFISVAWDKSHLEENLTFLADSLLPKKNEPSRETLRRYLCDSFFKDHLQTYKKRPIYWLFSSGKQKAFQCLVYLHRCHEGTLARMRMEYVIPLQGKMSSRIEQSTSDIPKASSTSQRKALEKERDKLLKHQTELRAFDEKLRHFADQRIKLDLDNGVKVNYGKFGDLLAEVKAVAGGTDED